MSLLYRQIIILTLPMSILMDLVREQAFPACRQGKAEAMGVSFDEINQTISVAAGSNYVNDYTNNGRVQQVIVGRMRHTGCSLNNFWLCLLKPSGADASVIHFCNAFVECCTAATDTLSGISCHTHNRQCRTGKSSGTAMAAMDNLAKHLPPGFAGEWAGSSLQEKESASQLPGLIVLSVLVVFMVLAALYESWSVPSRSCSLFLWGCSALCWPYPLRI